MPTASKPQTNFLCIKWRVVCIPRFHLPKASLQASYPTFSLVKDSAFSHLEESHKLQSPSNVGGLELCFSTLKVQLISHTATYIYVWCLVANRKSQEKNKEGREK
ncbi:hypothetical protein L1049_016169 [Liquidambar formosana]|uniref:Uncharacterized protein n=1 Tax=Liquidambar formosana TaxID=63359 RepID=A0AAP0S065_LIQFO